MITNLLPALAPVLPYLIVGAIFLVLCVLAALIVLLSKAKKVPATPLAQEEPQEFETESTKTSSSVEFVRGALALETRSSFATAMRFLRATASRRNYRYQTPWCLLVGQSGSAKTTLLANPNFRGTIYSREVDFGHGVPLGWRFFHHGIVLDVCGDFFLRADGETSDERAWRSLLELLRQHRSRRPIDGVILTIPCTDLLGSGAQDSIALGRKGQHIRQKLEEAQKWLEMSFPIYVLVTKCDHILGFANFCQELPTSHLRDAFGWSNPSNLTAAFTASWIDDAFESVSQQLWQLQSEIFASRHEVGDPEGFFLFPGEFQKLQTPLRIYLDQIFKESSYYQSFRLRGIYFCGDPSTEPFVESARLLTESADQQIASGGPAARETSEAPPQLSERSPAFVEDLIEKKIFPESGLAAPLTSSIRFRSRAIRTALIASLVLLAIFAIGTSIDGYKLAELNSVLLPLLQTTERHFTQHSPMEKTEAIRDQTVDVINTIAKDKGLRSAFMPDSWDNSLNDRIDAILLNLYKEQVLKGFQVLLHDKAVAITELPAAEVSKILDAATDPAEWTQSSAGSSLEQSPEFAALRDFIQQLKDFKEAADRYNYIGLPQKGEIADLIAVLKYLYPGSEQGIEDSDALRQIVQQTKAYPFLFMIRDPASEKFKRLVDNLFTAQIDNSVFRADLEYLGTALEALNGSRQASYEELKDLLDSIARMDRDLHNQSISWVVSESPIGLPLFQRDVRDLIQLSVFDANLAAYAQEAAEQKRSKLREEMMSSDSERPTGPVLEWKGSTPELAADVRALRVALENALQLPFMAAITSGTRLESQIPSGESIFWNKSSLEDALGMYDSYRRYLQESLTSTPAKLRATMQRITLARLEAAMSDQIVQAKELRLSQPTLDSATDPDQLPEAKSFQQAVGSLLQALQAFGNLRFVNSHAALQLLTTSQARGMLAQLDRKLVNAAPYAVRGGNFNWWNGKTPVNLAAFDVDSPEDLTAHLAFDQGRIRTLASQAEIVINFLNSVEASGRSAAEAQSILKWQQINEQFKKLDAKTPGNSVAALEDFVRTDMVKAVPDVDCQGAPPANVGGANADYFLQIRNRLSREILDRCRVLADALVSRNYTEIANLFNQSLSGRFPFVSTDSSPNGEEADPDAIPGFYKAFDQYQKLLREALAQPSRFGNGAAALSFLTQMDRVRAIFAPLLMSADQPFVPVFDFVPSFRVNRSREVEGNQVIDWGLQVGAQSFAYGAAPSTGRWKYGDSVQLTLRWAKDSPDLPVSVPGQSDMTVVDHTATYTFRDPWSLVSMLVRHKAPAADLDRLLDSQPNTLVFHVRTAPDGTSPAGANGRAVDAKVFIRLALMLPEKKESLAIPTFPVRAPELQGKTNDANGQ